MTKRNAPGWGKTIGIMMIILGSLGVFYQFYKLVIPKILGFQQSLINTIGDEVQQNQTFQDSVMTHTELRESFDQSKEIFNTLNDTVFRIDPEVITYLTISSIIMLIICVIYIIAGTKLLSPSTKNYQFTLYTLIISIIISLISFIFIFSGNNSAMIFGIMFYAFIGVVADVVFLIIMQSSDKSAYGIGEPKTISTDNINNEDHF